MYNPTSFIKYYIISIVVNMTKVVSIANFYFNQAFSMVEKDSKILWKLKNWPI